MEVAELPGRGLGVQVGAHLYPLRWRAVTFGIGGELAASRARKTPPQSLARACVPRRSGTRRSRRSSRSISAPVMGGVI